MKRTIAVIIPTMYQATLPGPAAVLRSIRAAARRGGFRIVTVVVVNDAPVSVTADDIIRSSGIGRTEVRMLVSHINKGFAPAVNDGIIYARTVWHPEWFFVLNDDATVFPALFHALEIAIRGHAYDAVSCMVNGTDGTVESIGLRYDRTGLAFPVRNPRSIPRRPIFAGTAVFLSRSRVDREVSRHGYVFNPLFFAYAEDLELSLRIHRDGGTIYIMREPLIIHAGSRTAKRGSFFQLYYGFRNLILVVMVLWPWSEIVWYLPLLGSGLLYMAGMSLYKRYYLLLPKIAWWIIRHRGSIAWQRIHYDP